MRHTTESDHSHEEEVVPGSLNETGADDFAPADGQTAAAEPAEGPASLPEEGTQRSGHVEPRRSEAGPESAQAQEDQRQRNAGSSPGSSNGSSGRTDSHQLPMNGGSHPTNGELRSSRVAGNGHAELAPGSFDTMTFHVGGEPALCLTAALLCCQHCASAEIILLIL
jgi:hypothetical protein